MSVSVRFLYGGKFYLSKDEYPSLCYKKELVYWKKNVDPDLLSKIELEEFIKDGGVMKTVNELWFSKAGKKIHDGLQQILKDRDIVELCESVGKDNTIDVFVVQEGDGSPHDLVDFSKGRKIRSPSKIYSPTKIVNAQKVEVIPRGGITSSSAKKSNPKGAPPSSSKPQSRTSKYIPPSLSKPLSRPLLESLALCESSGGSDEDVNSGDSSTQEFSYDELLGSESSEELSSDDEPYDTNIFEDESDDDQEFEKNVDKDILDENVNKDQCTGDLFDVDLQRRSCGCNMWELTGLPCCHAVCCILKRRLDIEQFVSPYFHKETYLRAYGLSVNPMPGQDQWEKTVQPPLDPPKLVVQPGRPRKKRRKEPGEGSSKSTRIRLGRNKCGNCGVEGHTRKTCKNPPKPPEPPKVPVRGGRTPKESTLPTQIKKRKYTKRKVRSTNTFEVEANVQVANEQDNDMQAMIESAMQS